MRIEWMILADSAEVINNKLYLMGGGWDHLKLGRKFPARQMVSIAVSVLLDGNDSDSTPLNITIEDEDQRRLATVNANLAVQQPVPAGQTRRVQLAFRLPIRFEKPGVCRVAALSANQQLASATFRVSQETGSKGIRRTPSSELQA